MNNILKKTSNSIINFFKNPTNVFWFGMIIALTATSLEVFRGRNTNYFDYQDSTLMFLQGISPYNLEYADAHAIYFLYSPVFSVLFAPIFLLPWWLGPYVWNITNYSLFYLSIRTLPSIYNPYKNKIFLFLLPVLLQAIFCYQHNTIVCYIFIFAYSLLERGRYFWAVLLIMISACTKVYGGIELAMLLCYPKAWRNYAYAVLCGAVLLCLPLLNPNFDNPFELYEQMFEMISSHHSDSDFIGILFARGLKPFLLPNYRIVQLGVLAILSILFFVRYDRWKSFHFRTQVLAVIMGYIILFSDCPETHTYLISLSGYSLVFFLKQNKKWFDWVLFWLLVFNFGIIPTDVLCPAWLHEYIHKTFWLDVYTFTICWFRILWWAVGPKENYQTMKKSTRIVMIALLCCIPATINAQMPRKSVPTSKIYTVKGVRFTMKFVQGGSFIMGSKPSNDITTADESPRHKVVVNNFYIGETEVTQELWEAVMGKNRSKFKGPKNPVDYVTYEDCLEFIDKLNSITKANFRLPTEAEWEYAARGGKKSKGYKYSGSNNAQEVAVTDAYPGHRHLPVAQKKPNELGLYDMSGNVWEWCEDFYGRYDSPKKSWNFHVIRGGGWHSPEKFCTTTNRFPYDTRRRQRFVGLRLAIK